MERRPDASDGLRLRVPGLLKLLDPALEIRDQFVALVDFPDHLLYPGVGISELPLKHLLKLVLQPIVVRHRYSPPSAQN
jgi:hypothetical protein